MLTLRSTADRSCRISILLFGFTFFLNHVSSYYSHLKEEEEDVDVAVVAGVADTKLRPRHVVMGVKRKRNTMGDGSRDLFARNFVRLQGPGCCGCRCEHRRRVTNTTREQEHHEMGPDHLEHHTEGSHESGSSAAKPPADCQP